MSVNIASTHDIGLVLYANNYCALLMCATCSDKLSFYKRKSGAVKALNHQRIDFISANGKNNTLIY